MYPSEATRELMQKIALGVIRTRHPNSISTLKKFLTVLRSPTDIRDVLLSTVEVIIEEDPELARWLLAQHSLLLPELNLLSIAQQLALRLLQEQGWVQNQDFTFGEDGYLQASDTIKVHLLAAASVHEQLLLEILL